MTQCVTEISVTVPISIVVPVYNDWAALRECLRSLDQQTNPPEFEVIIVDDGSQKPVPEALRQAPHKYSLSVIRQAHSGIPSARNLGIRAAKGGLLLFVDADCRLQTDCLAALQAALNNPQHHYFQLQIVGNSSSLVGRAEQLRLLTFQSYMLQPDGRIRYLNTAGFAIRRDKVDFEKGVFDPAAMRAEDTLLLAHLIEDDELPLFVPGAIVEHAISLSLMQCVRKDIRSVSLESRAYGIIASKGVKIRVTHGERLKLLWTMWKAAGKKSIGRSAWFVVVLRQSLQRLISFATNLGGV